MGFEIFLRKRPLMSLQRIRGWLRPLVPSQGERFDRAAGVDTAGSFVPSDLTVLEGAAEEGLTMSQRLPGSLERGSTP